MIEHLRHEREKGAQKSATGGERKIGEKMWWKWFNQSKVCHAPVDAQTQAIKAAMTGLGSAGFKQEEKDIKLEEVSTKGDPGGDEWRNTIKLHNICIWNSQINKNVL